MHSANGSIVVAADTRHALSTTDDALLSHTQMFAAAITTAKAIQAPVGITQKLYQTMGDGIGAILASRKAMQTSIAIMRSVATERGFIDALEGCPDGFPSAHSDAQPVAGIMADATA